MVVEDEPNAEEELFAEEETPYSVLLLLDVVVELEEIAFFITTCWVLISWLAEEALVVALLVKSDSIICMSFVCCLWLIDCVECELDSSVSKDIYVAILVLSCSLF